MTCTRTLQRRSALAAVALLAVVGAGCAESSIAETVPPAQVEKVDTDLWRVVLTERAAERTGLETGTVAIQEIDGAERLVVPYSAVMYHYDGSTWTYTNREPLTFLREQIEIDYIDAAVAVLNQGPDVGTKVVTVGAAELYGVEFGIGK